MNIQDVLLNQLRKEKVTVIIEDIKGNSYQGIIRGFDNFCIFFQTEQGNALLYKHSLLKIKVPKEFYLKMPERESSRKEWNKTDQVNEAKESKTIEREVIKKS